MSYTPTNIPAFVAAYSGAIAGMATPGWLVDPTRANYDLVTRIAGAFAQAFDTVWADATQLNNLELASITSITSNDFARRGPGPLADPTFQTVGNWTQAARACAALVLECDAYFAGQGINPGTPGGGGSGYQTIEVNSAPLTQETTVNFVGTDIHGSTVGSVTTIAFGAESVSVGQSSASLLQVGASVVNPAFTAAYAVAPTTATLTDTEGNTNDITSTPTSFVSPHTFTKSVYGQQVTFTVAVTSSEGPANGSATKSWVQTVRWGNVADPGSGYNSAFIAALNHNSLQFGPNGTFAANAAVGESEFYATRAAFGVTSLNFTVNGLPFAITKVAANVPYTNTNGVTENYDVWKSDSTGLGAFNFVVSGA